jgi:vacuolar-type H+-ATPase subunit D/Vma8
MEPEAYIELTMELSRIKTEVEMMREDYAELQNKYFNLIDRFTDVNQEVLAHYAVCPMGGVW